MYRKFIATVTAVSIALTAMGSAPAVAGEYDNARMIAALLGLAVVGKIIIDKKKDRKQQHVYQPAPVHQQPKYQRPQTHQPKQHTPKYAQPTHNLPRYQQPKPRPLPQRADRKLLPQQCLRSFETYRGKVRMFGSRCLQRSYEFVGRLPQQCQFIFNTPKGDRRGYEARCLRDRGYRLARG